MSNTTSRTGQADALGGDNGQNPAPARTSVSLASATDHYPLDLLGTDSRLTDASWYMRGWTVRYRMLKRLFDVVVSLALGLLALPVMAVLAVLIPLDSRGPVIYRQTRIGKDRKRFQIYKLRTMGVDAEANGAVYAAKNDPRVTRLGRHLRRTRLDELPQIVNVLKGEMSIIGPRPERPENEQMLEEALPGFALRTLVRPGLTGWAQIKAPYANTTEQTGKKLEYDLYYVKNASFSLDLRIAAHTLRVMLRFAGQ